MPTKPTDSPALSARTPLTECAADSPSLCRVIHHHYTVMDRKALVTAYSKNGSTSLRSIVTNSDLENTLSAIPDHSKRPSYQRQNTSRAITIPEQAHTRVSLGTGDDESNTSCANTNSTDAVLDTERSVETTHLNTTDIQEREPSPKYPYEWMNTLRWQWLSVYRRLNLIVLIANILIIITFAIQDRLLQLDPNTMSTALAANITTAILFRQEFFVNSLFVTIGRCPPSWPLWIKRHAGKVYHFGGIHSGAGMASIIWLALFDLSLVLQYKHTAFNSHDAATAIVTGLLNVLLVSVVISSHPKFRETYHDMWEAIHRFGGWLAVVLFWTNFGLLADNARRQQRPNQSIHIMLFTSATFWMLIVITLCIIMPWLRLRKVRVEAVWQSKYAVRFYFDYMDLPLCAAPRFSTSPLKEWHSFAGIPNLNGKGFSVLISGIGDWTKSMVTNPPARLWTRGLPVRGVLHLAPMFGRIVLVATGSGIGPVLSLLQARKVNCRILWCTRDPSMTYAPDVLSEVLSADPEAKIIARAKGQRDPDLGKLAYELHQASGAEAVFIISNKQGCYSARMWLESRGVVVFTPIFDS